MAGRKAEATAWILQWSRPQEICPPGTASAHILARGSRDIGLGWRRILVDSFAYPHITILTVDDNASMGIREMANTASDKGDTSFQPHSPRKSGRQTSSPLRPLGYAGRDKRGMLMWWMIGIGGIVVAAFVFSKIRTVSHQAQLIKAGSNHLWHSFRMLKEGADRLFDREIDVRVWRDPYLLGYTQGSLAIMTVAFGKRLNTVQKGMVIVRVLQDMAGEHWQEAFTRIEALNGTRDPEFVRGVKHGSDVAILMSSRAGPELLAKPDVQRALREAPEQTRRVEAVLGPTDTDQSGAAGALLMQEYMERHKREANY